MYQVFQSVFKGYRYLINQGAILSFLKTLPINMSLRKQTDNASTTRLTKKHYISTSTDNRNNTLSCGNILLLNKSSSLFRK